MTCTQIKERVVGGGKREIGLCIKRGRAGRIKLLRQGPSKCTPTPSPQNAFWPKYGGHIQFLPRIERGWEFESLVSCGRYTHEKGEGGAYKIAVAGTFKMYPHPVPPRCLLAKIWGGGIYNFSLELREGGSLRA